MQRKSLVALLFALVLLVGGTLWNQAVTTNNGAVKVRRVTYSDDMGNMVSAQLYIPKTATAETPAPAVLTNHGGGNSSEAQSAYNIELARRGFVVLSWDASNSGSSEKSSDPTHGGEASYDFIQTLDYVQRDQLAASGHSMGGVYSFAIAGNHPDTIKLEVAIGMQPGMNNTADFNTNYVCIIGSMDESSLVRSNSDILNMAHNDLFHTFFGLAEDEVLEVNRVYGNFEDGTARVFYMPSISHSGAMISTVNIELYLETVMTVLDAPNPIAADNQVWMGKDYAMVLQFAGLICFLFAMASLLLKSKLFASLVLPARKSVGYAPKTPMWYVGVGILLVVPVVLFIPFATIAQRVDVTGVFKLDNTANGFVLWALLTGVVLFVLFLVFHFVTGRKNGGGLLNYGLATKPDKAKIKLGYIAKAFGFAITLMGLTYIVYLLMYVYTAGDIHIWLATLRPITITRAPFYPIYLLCQIPFFLASTLCARAINLNNGERTDGSGMRNSVLMSVMFGTLGFIVLFTVFQIVFRTTGTVMFPANRGYIYAVCIFSMLPAFGVGNAINCYVTNKTNSIYAGLFSACLWTSWVLVAANAIF